MSTDIFNVCNMYFMYCVGLLFILWMPFGAINDNNIIILVPRLYSDMDLASLTGFRWDIKW